MTTLNPGANTKDQRFYLTIENESWGEFEKVDGLKVKVDGEVTYYEPGSSFEAKAGGNFKIDDIALERHGKIGRDAPHAKKFLDAATKGQQLAGVGSYHDVQADGSISPTPTVSVNVVVNGCETGDVDSKSGDRMYKYTLGVNGAPIA